MLLSNYPLKDRQFSGRQNLGLVKCAAFRDFAFVAQLIRSEPKPLVRRRAGFAVENQNPIARRHSRGRLFPIESTRHCVVRWRLTCLWLFRRSPDEGAEGDDEPVDGFRGFFAKMPSTDIVSTLQFGRSILGRPNQRFAVPAKQVGDALANVGQLSAECIYHPSLHSFRMPRVWWRAQDTARFLRSSRAIRPEYAPR